MYKCVTPIKALLLRAFSKLMGAQKRILEDCQLWKDTLCNCNDMDKEQADLTEEMDVLSDIVRHCVEENGVKVQNQTEYLESYDRHVRRYDKLKAQYEALEAERQRRKEKSDRLEAFMLTLSQQEQIPIVFSDDLWLATLDHMTVYADETIVFTFKSGMEIKEQMM